MGVVREVEKAEPYATDIGSMKHNTRNTVSVAKYCKKCQRQTQHRNDGTRTGPCLECMAELERKHNEQKPDNSSNQQAGFDFS